MKTQISFFVLASVVSSMISPCLSAYADSESISQIRLNLEQKQTLLHSLQTRKARHQKQTLEEIAEDFRSESARTAVRMTRNGQDPSSYEKIATQSIDGIKTIGDKDAILAIEESQIQQTMTSENVIYGATRAVFFPSDGKTFLQELNPLSECHKGGNAGYCALEMFVGIPYFAVVIPVAFVLTSAFDTAVLPVEALVSWITGF